LAAVVPHDVVSLSVPRRWALGAAVYLLALGLTLGPLVRPPVAAQPPAPPDAVLAEAQQIEEYAKELEHAAEELNSPELKKLAEEMRKVAEELRQPGTDLRAALAQMSELQAAIAQMQKEFDTKLVEGEMKNLGQAMAAARPLQEAGKALQDGK